MRNYKQVLDVMEKDLKNPDTLLEILPWRDVEYLRKQMPMLRIAPDIREYLIEINRQIANRINKCEHFFPMWFKWEYQPSIG